MSVNRIAMSFSLPFNVVKDIEDIADEYHVPKSVVIVWALESLRKKGVKDVSRNSKSKTTSTK